MKTFSSSRSRPPPLPLAPGPHRVLAAHLEPSGHGLIVHDGLHAQLLTLGVAHPAEVLALPQNIVGAVTCRSAGDQLWYKT